MKFITANAHQNQQCIFFFKQMKTVKCEQIKKI